MKIEIERDLVKEYLKLIDTQKEQPGVKELKEAFKRETEYRHSDVDLDATKLPEASVAILYKVARELRDYRNSSALSSYQSLLKNPSGSKVGNIRALAEGLKLFLLADYIDGWLYEFQEETYRPYLVKSIRVERYIDRHNSSAPPQYTVNLAVIANYAKNASGRANERDNTREFSFSSDDITKKTIPEILAAKRLYHETPELKEDYVLQREKFEAYQPQFGKQFICSNVTSVIKRDRHYNSQEDIDINRRNNVKAVNDEELINRAFLKEITSEYWEDKGHGDKFTQVPIHCSLFMFHLQLHSNMWVHVNNLKPYAYDKTLVNRLVLPEDHKDLVNTLMEPDAFLDSEEDIIQGKSGGTSILCVGDPGLGKTLTAEVYSELSERPLYKVHAGQLGLNPEELEKTLRPIMARAERWGAILLIDEADVYMRHRGTDMHYNAIVTAFLQVLEYYKGIMFLTSNRDITELDKAILNRFMARITYNYPDEPERKRLWEIYMAQVGIKSDPALIDELVIRYPKVSGRDIKQSLRLVRRQMHTHGVPFSFEVFAKWATFRGLAAVNEGD